MHGSQRSRKPTAGERSRVRRFNMRSETKSSVVRNSKPITWGFACRPDIRCYMQRDSTRFPCGRHGFHHTEGGRVIPQNLSAAPTPPSNSSSQPSPANLWSCSPAMCSRSSIERLDDPAQRSKVRCGLRDLDCPTTAVCKTGCPPKPTSVGDLATRGCPGAASLTVITARGA